MKIEYAVCTDTIEIKSSTLVGSKRIGKPFPRSFTADEIEKIYFGSDNLDEKIVKRFDNEQEAVEAASKMQVSTKFMDWTVPFLSCDIVTVEEITTDDDGKEEWTGLYLFRVEPFEYRTGAEPARISIDNGMTYCTVSEAIEAKDWDLIVSFMDDDVREDVHDELAPCTNEEFLTRYLELANDDLIIG